MPNERVSPKFKKFRHQKILFSTSCHAILEKMRRHLMTQAIAPSISSVHRTDTNSAVVVYVRVRGLTANAQMQVFRQSLFAAAATRIVLQRSIRPRSLLFVRSIPVPVPVIICRSAHMSSAAGTTKRAAETASAATATATTGASDSPKKHKPNPHPAVSHPADRRALLAATEAFVKSEMAKNDGVSGCGHADMRTCGHAVSVCIASDSVCGGLVVCG